MAVKFGRITRGRGKIYRLLHVSELPAQGRLQVRSATSTRRDVPAKVVPYGHDGDWLLIVPILSVAQTVTVEELDSDSAIINRSTCVITPRMAGLQSKANTFLKHADILGVRNFDAQALEGEWDIQLIRMVSTPKGQDVVQGTAQLLARSREELAGPVQIAFQDMQGEACDEGGWVCRGDAVAPIESYPGWLKRTVDFSVRIDGKLPAFIVSVTGAGATGFVGFDAEDVEDYRQWWRNNAKSVGDFPYYMDWYKRTHEASQATLAMQRSKPTDDGPLFSIIVPLFNTPLPFFQDMVASVLNQSYSKLELVLVNASPDNAKLAQTVHSCAAADSRVRVLELERNLGITLNTRAGIQAATGDYLCFLDHDDVLALDALYCYAESIQSDPSCDLLYCDEDLLEGVEFGRPFFKPAWSPDLLLGMNYVCHFLCVSRAALEQIELPGSEYDGAQDHYLALAVGEIARSVCHVPRVLYHWRVHPTSTASSINAKLYAVEAGRKAVQAHLDRVCSTAVAKESQRIPGRYEVEYQLEQEPLVSVVIPNKDAVDMLDRCLNSIIEKTRYTNYEIIIVENNSEKEETFSYYEHIQQEYSHIKVISYSGSFNYSAICNMGVKESRGEYILLLNNDTEVISPEWMGRMVELCSRKQTGAVGAKLLYPDDTVQHCGIGILFSPCHMCYFMDREDPGYYEVLHIMHNVSAVTGACLMVSRHTYDEVGGLDEDLPVDFNDVDFCLKIRSAGYHVVLDPTVELYHYESVSRGVHEDSRRKFQFTRDIAEMNLRWPEYQVFGDPFYNKNFDQTSVYYAIDRSAKH